MLFDKYFRAPFDGTWDFSLPADYLCEIVDNAVDINPVGTFNRTGTYTPQVFNNYQNPILIVQNLLWRVSDSWKIQWFPDTVKYTKTIILSWTTVKGSIDDFWIVFRRNQLVTVVVILLILRPVYKGSFLVEWARLFELQWINPFFYKFIVEISFKISEVKIIFHSHI